MTRRFLVQTGSVVASVLLMVGIAAAAERTQSQESSSTHYFLTEAAQGGLAEVTLGQMAADKGENDAVKEFGRRMVRDHGKANDQLKSLATTVGAPLPTEISAEAKALQQRLEKLSGAEFDQTYIHEMLKDHKKDITAFEKQAQHGQDVQVKEWAKKTLPTLKEHLDLAQRTAKRVGAKERTDIDASGGMRAAASDSKEPTVTSKTIGDQ
jgi:putative membrane protein